MQQVATITDLDSADWTKTFKQNSIAGQQQRKLPREAVQFVLLFKTKQTNPWSDWYAAGHSFHSRPAKDPSKQVLYDSLERALTSQISQLHKV